MALDSLKQLDERIQALINGAQKLKKENEQLTQHLGEVERRLNELGAQLKQVESERRQHEVERGEIKGRIEKLLARFDGLDLSKL